MTQAMTGELCETPGFAAVGFMNGSYGECTGTRIACSVVLTAAHCVNKKTSGPIQPYLFTDQEENVVVAASSNRMRRHALIRIRLDGSKPHVDRVHVGQGELAMAPWVDAGGYALPIARKGKLPKILRHESLAGRKGAWSDMQGCL